MFTLTLKGTDKLRERAERSRAAAAQAPSIFQHYVDEAGNLWLKGARQEAPKKSGKMAGALQVRADGGAYRWDLKLEAPDAPYMVFVVGGTAAHTIEPNRASVLHFQVDGQDVYAHEVRHPGSKPNPFDKRGYEAVRGEIKERLVETRRQIFGLGD
jgi:hypothetical protein